MPRLDWTTKFEGKRMKTFVIFWALSIKICHGFYLTYFSTCLKKNEFTWEWQIELFWAPLSNISNLIGQGYLKTKNFLFNPSQSFWSGILTFSLISKASPSRIWIYCQQVWTMNIYDTKCQSFITRL